MDQSVYGIVVVVGRPQDQITEAVASEIKDRGEIR